MHLGFLTIVLIATALQSPVRGYDISKSLVRSIQDMKASFEQICVENGYQVRAHDVVTPDGYVLTIY